MSIEWDKIESKPGKGYKVQGEDLLALRQNLFSLEKDVATLKNERDDLNANIDSLKKNISDLEEQVRQKDNKISSLETDLKQADEAISKSQEAIDNVKAEKVAEISKVKEEMNVQIAQLNKEREAAKETIQQQMVSQASEAENTISNLNNQIEQMLKDIETKDNTITDKETQIADLNSKIAGLNGHIDELNANIEELKEQIPKKPVYEEAEVTEKGAACPKCGWTVLEDYKIVDGVKHLIRKRCPNTFCMWTSVEEQPKIAISMSDEEPGEIETPTLKMYRIKGTELEEIQKLESSMVALLADYPQETVWIWKGAESSRFEYAEATRQATYVKNDILKKTNAHIVRVTEGEEPENFPKTP